jgi:hypothetical protein
MSLKEVAISRQLSADAAPFTPKIALTYFEQFCPTFSLSENTHSAPTGFSLVTFPFVEVKMISVCF